MKTTPIETLRLMALRPICKNEKTYSDGHRVRCGGWATHGEYCELCAIRLRFIPKPRRVCKESHEWLEEVTDQDEDVCQRCGISRNENEKGDSEMESTTATTVTTDKKEEPVDKKIAKAKKTAARKATKVVTKATPKAAKKGGNGRVKSQFQFNSKVAKGVFEEVASGKHLIAAALKKHGPITNLALAEIAGKAGWKTKNENKEEAIGQVIFGWKKAGYITKVNG